MRVKKRRELLKILERLERVIESTQDFKHAWLNAPGQSEESPLSLINKAVEITKGGDAKS